jgi:DNA-binding PadR family transcriptional regulator
MSIKHAILGYLSWQPFSGYDLKKLIAGSPSLHWSGNNNQIYTTLVQLHRDGLVSSEVQQQAHYPARKVYTLTEAGRAELKQWVLSAPELPQFRHPFLIQLAWADQLDVGELDALLARYENEVEMQLLMCREQARRGIAGPARTPREALLWRMISQNTIDAYSHELAWVRQVRAELGPPNPEEESTP